MDASEALTLWIAEGAIDDELADRLRASLASHEEPERANKLIWTLISIGAVLIGGGLLLFIASQWDQSSPTRRLALLIVIYLLVVASATLANRQQLGITARGLWFLSSIAVGVNIFLVGQVFNLPLNYWHGTLLWMIATLAMGWAAPSSAQGWLAVPLGLLTLGWISTPSAFAFDQAAFLFEPGGIKALLPLIGLALVATGLLLDDSDFDWLQHPLHIFGALLVATPITVSTFHPDAFAWIFQFDVRLFHFVVIAVAVALVALTLQREPQSPLLIAFAAVTALLLVVLPQVDDDFFDFGFDTNSAPWMAESFAKSEVLFGIYTAVIFGLALATILVGQHFVIRALVNMGFAVVSVLLFAVYVGRIAGELPTSLAVLLGGLLLVGGAIFLERKRRDVTSNSVSELSS